ncbi:MAG: hypothetical protein M3040_05080 [Bacteroidota bacterium]|nr:hypothetical protein [Bacteroidota bacterium]
MATMPTTAPTQKPRAEGLRLRSASQNIQDKPATEEAILIVAKVLTANPFATRAEPALKTNQSIVILFLAIHEELLQVLFLFFSDAPQAF